MGNEQVRDGSLGVVEAAEKTRALNVSAVFDQEFHQIHAVHHHRKRQQLSAVPLHLGAPFDEQLRGIDAAAADRMAQQRDFPEVVDGIDGVDEFRMAIDMAAQRGQVAQPRRREHVVDGAVLHQRRYERRLPFLRDGQRRDRHAGSHLHFVAGHGRLQGIARGRMAIGAGFQRQVKNVRAVAVRRDPGQRAVVHAAPAGERSVLRQRLADIFRASFGGVIQQRLELHLRRIVDAVAALAKFLGFRLGTVNHGLGHARKGPHDLLRVETAGNERRRAYSAATPRPPWG
jgi:hypothetical protein